jgi:hypothetical protein
MLEVVIICDIIKRRSYYFMEQEKKEIIIGAYYETLDNKIVYTYGSGPDGIKYRFDDDSGGHLISKEDFFKWKIRNDLRDFPNARDPRVPYIFDLNYDLKYTSDVVRYLKDNPNDSNVIELIASHASDNKKLKKYVDKYNKDLNNFLTVTETVYELETKNFFYNIIEKKNTGCIIKRQNKNNLNSDKADWSNQYITEILSGDKTFKNSLNTDIEYLPSTTDCVKLIEKEEKKANKNKENKRKL